MTRTIDGLDALRTAMAGAVLAPGDDGYDDARKVWNADVDKRPLLIAGCASTSDVAAAVSFARERGLEIAIRSGAHSTTGACVTDGGVMIDLRALNTVSVDPEARRVRVGGGALLGDVDAATTAHGLAAPFGVVSHTGVGGLTLGGGLGWLTRKFGASIDNLVSAEVVLADGRVVRASADSEPDLFWALRGGGGNFGVVTEFEFRLHPMNPMVDLGFFFWELDQGPAVLRLLRELVADLAPDLNVIFGGLNAPPAPFVPEAYHLVPGYGLMVVGFDGTPAHAPLLEQIRAAVPPAVEMVTPIPYVALQQMQDEGTAWGFHNYIKGTFVEELSDDVIDVIAERIPRKASPLSMVLFYLLDGAYSQVGEDDTAFGGGRSPRYAVFLVGTAPNAELMAADRAWVRELWDALRPLAIGSGEGYVNDLVDIRDEARVRATYGAKYDRLARIKAQYDPGNVFHLNANIKPA
ncbi:MAG: FAD-binding oxidoreductase [Pseudonocardia sp.]